MLENQRARNERMRIENEKLKNPEQFQTRQQQTSQFDQKKEPESEMIKMFREMQQLKMMSKMFGEDNSANPQLQMMMQQINDLKTELKTKEREGSFMEAMKMNQTNMVNPKEWLESHERLSDKHLQLIAERQKMEIDRLRDELKLIGENKTKDNSLGNAMAKKVTEYLEKNVDIEKILGKNIKEEEKSLFSNPEFLKTLIEGGLTFANKLTESRQTQAQQPQQQQYYSPSTAGAYPVQSSPIIVPEQKMVPNGHVINSTNNFSSKKNDLDFMHPDNYEVNNQVQQSSSLDGFESSFLRENPV